MKIKFIFAWYDLWIGIYWDRKKRDLYILLIPCFGIVLKFGNNELDENKELYEACKLLYLENADYIKINNLGDINHNKSMQRARDILNKINPTTV